MGIAGRPARKGVFYLEQQTIAYLIKQLLRRVLLVVVAVVAIVGVSLYMFASYVAVVNDAGVVRGGSQRIVKQVLAGADASKTTATIEGLLSGLGSRVHLGAFPAKRDAAEAYWQSEVKPAIAEYQETQNPDKLLEVSETYFGKTNEMVAAAQDLVDIMAALLYVILLAFVAVVFVVLKRVYSTFNERVVEPLGALEGSVTNLADGHMSQKFEYPRQDEIGQLYDLLNKMRTGILGYVQDIDQNLSTMASGDLVSATSMSYVGDYAPIQRNLSNIRAAFCEEMQNIGDMAEQVAGASGEVSKVSQSLAEGAMSQNESVQELQTKIHETMQENAKVDTYVEEAHQSSIATNQSIEESRAQMDNVVAAMQEISTASEEIRSILGTLDEITGQTALLALNASIEAARAGEAGRGFAVVADEVRKLAEQSASSTQNIQELIGKALAAIESGTEVVNTAADSLANITTSTDAVNAIIDHLSEQSSKQLKMMEAVNSLSRDILGVVTDNSAVSEECAASSTELANFSDALKESVAKFKTR